MSLANKDRTSIGEHTFEGQALRWSLEGEVLEVELRRTPCNELGTIALEELEALLRTLEWIAHRVRAVLFFSSVEKGFCAGADLVELQRGLRHLEPAAEVDERSYANLRDFVDRIHRVFRRIDHLPVPTIAAVHGFCFGGGFELALCADVVIADRSARFCFPELRLGLIPGFGGIPRLKRKAGEALVLDLLLSGRSIQAQRAHALGLVSQVVGRGEALDTARRLAAQTLLYDRAAIFELKCFTKRNIDDELRAEREVFLKLLTSPTVRASLSDFVARKDDPHAYLPRVPSAIDIDDLLRA